MKNVFLKLKAIKNKYVYFFVVLGVLLVVSAILNLITPNIITGNNTWKNLTPGKSSLNDVKKTLGEPQQTQQYTGYRVLEYESAFPTMPNEVALDNNDRIVFIKEFLTYDAENNLSQYLEKYGEVDLELFAPMVSKAVKAYVFLDEGVVIIAHLKDGSVEQKWYFIPSDKETFMKSWEKELQVNDAGPERHVP